MMRRKETGILGEKLACEFLKKKGYRILETNYRCPCGEIDIISRQNDCLVFVEVRTTTNSKFVSPEGSITHTKMKHLEHAAEHYRQHHDRLPESWRIDMVAIELDDSQKVNPFEE
jgi:putative endonuclease